MATTTRRMATTNPAAATLVLRFAIVVLALATAYIHATLGGLLFTLNAIGYAGLAVALVLPGPIARARWLTRLALIGFAGVTIAGWLAFGARFPLAYLDKAIEVGLILATVIDLWRSDGNPLVIARRIRHLPSNIIESLRTLA